MQKGMFENNAVNSQCLKITQKSLIFQHPKMDHSPKKDKNPKIDEN